MSKRQCLAVPLAACRWVVVLCADQPRTLTATQAFRIPKLKEQLVFEAGPASKVPNHTRVVNMVKTTDGMDPGIARACWEVLVHVICCMDQQAVKSAVPFIPVLDEASQRHVLEWWDAMTVGEVEMPLQLRNALSASKEVALHSLLTTRSMPQSVTNPAAMCEALLELPQVLELAIEDQRRLLLTMREKGFSASATPDFGLFQDCATSGIMQKLCSVVSDAATIRKACFKHLAMITHVPQTKWEALDDDIGITGAALFHVLAWLLQKGLGFETSAELPVFHTFRDIVLFHVDPQTIVDGLDLTDAKTTWFPPYILVNSPDLNNRTLRLMPSKTDDSDGNEQDFAWCAKKAAKESLPIALCGRHGLWSNSHALLGLVAKNFSCPQSKKLPRTQWRIRDDEVLELLLETMPGQDLRHIHVMAKHWIKQFDKRLVEPEPQLLIDDAYYSCYGGLTFNRTEGSLGELRSGSCKTIQCMETELTQRVASISTIEPHHSSMDLKRYFGFEARMCDKHPAYRTCMSADVLNDDLLNTALMLKGRVMVIPVMHCNSAMLKLWFFEEESLNYGEVYDDLVMVDDADKVAENRLENEIR